MVDPCSSRRFLIGTDRKAPECRLEKLETTLVAVPLASRSDSLELIAVVQMRRTNGKSRVPGTQPSQLSWDSWRESSSAVFAEGFEISFSYRVHEDTILRKSCGRKNFGIFSS